MKVKWKKTGKSINAEGTTITYEGEGTPYFIESRTEHIPHANGIGTWDHTTYHLFNDAGKVKIFNRLADAKGYVEEMSCERLWG